MKEPSAPHVHYDGSLKELATRHVGLVKAILFVLTIVPAAWGVAAFLHQVVFYVPWDARAHETALSVWMKGGSSILGITCILYGFGNLLFRFYRLAALLYPHVALYFMLLVLVPFLNIMVILLLCRSGLKQMRARGLHVGFFGIDPARVD
jgi:uncharacterized oligopeptide transporter (OPT) family protein